MKSRLKYLKYALHSFLLTTLMGVPSLSGATETFTREYSIGSLQTGLSAFTDALIREPKNYEKIASIFDITINYLDTAVSSNTLVEKILKKQFTQKIHGNFIVLVDHTAIDTLLQELWDKKTSQLNPLATKILKQYKEYNVLHYKKDKKLMMVPLAGSTAFFAFLNYSYSKSRNNDDDLYTVSYPCDSAPSLKTGKEVREQYYAPQYRYASVAMAMLLAFIVYRYVCPSISTDFKE